MINTQERCAYVVDPNVPSVHVPVAHGYEQSHPIKIRASGFNVVWCTHSEDGCPVIRKPGYASIYVLMGSRKVIPAIPKLSTAVFATADEYVALSVFNNLQRCDSFVVAFESKEFLSSLAVPHFDNLVASSASDS